jgi:Uroporphyrinogen decarboxylase (URO-D)
MNGRERMKQAMENKFPDRVPVMCQLALGHYFLNTEINSEKIWFTSEGLSSALIQMQERYDFDGILVNMFGKPTNILDAVISTEDDGIEKKLTWRNEEITIIPCDDNAQHYLKNKIQLERADFDTINLNKLDSINSIKGYFWNIYHMPYIPELFGDFLPGEIPEYFFNTIDIVKSRVGNNVSVHGEVYSPFTHYIELLGYENALMSLLIDSEKAHVILDYLAMVVVSHAEATGNHGVDAVLISSAFAGGPFLSREMYREFVLPYEKMVTAAIKKTNTPVYTHTCGSIGDRLDLMMETGTMGIDTLDPPPLGNTDLSIALEELDGKVFVKGNMNAVEFLNFKTEDEIIKHATNRISIGKPGGAYILSTACSVAPRTEPWKLELLVPLAKKLGVY